MRESIENRDCRWIEEEIIADLHSNDPDRIKLALNDLDIYTYMSYFIELKSFGIEILEPFGNEVPEFIQDYFFNIITNYRFTPELTQETIEMTIIKMLLKYGYSKIGLELSFYVQQKNNKINPLQRIFEYISKQEIDNEISFNGMISFIDYLLDTRDDTLRRFALECLLKWPNSKVLRRIVDYIRPLLTDEENGLFNHIEPLKVYPVNSQFTEAEKEQIDQLDEIAPLSQEIITIMMGLSHADIFSEKPKNRIIAADSPLIHVAINQHFHTVFENSEREIDIGTVERIDGGYKFIYPEGSDRENAYYIGDMFDMFSARYLFHHVASIFFDEYNFSGVLTFQKNAYDLSILKKICEDFQTLFKGAVLYFVIDDKKILTITLILKG